MISDQTRRSRRPRWRRRAAMAGLIAALMFTGSACGSEQGTSTENAKAADLQAKLAPLDIDVETSTIVSLYGDDGGKVCQIAEDPAAMDREGLLAHPRFALRRLHVTTEAVAYTKAVIEVYCPDQLGNVEDYIAGLRVSDEN